MEAFAFFVLFLPVLFVTFFALATAYYIFITVEDSEFEEMEEK